jgi:hypothetical protein
MLILELGSRPVVPPEPKLWRRFYEAVVLTWALTQGYRIQGRLHGDIEPDGSQGAEREFHYFVNKLAMVCDSKKHGETVTSFVILQKPDQVVYMFASNSRTDAELAATKNFIEGLIGKVGRATLSSAAEKKASQKAVLQDIILFNEPRLTYYVQSFAAAAERCIGAYDRDSMRGKNPDALNRPT